MQRRVERIDDFLRQWAGLSGPYLIQANRIITYEEAIRYVEKAEVLLRELDITMQNVGLFADNSIEYVLGYFANAFSRNTNIPINVKLTDYEIKAELKYCDCNWVLCKEEFIVRIKTIRCEIPLGIISINSAGEFSIIHHSETSARRENNDDIAVMLHTSGTMGNPKKVMLTHGNLIANTQSNIDSLGLHNKDVVLVALPLFFGYCHTAQFLTHTRLGGSIVIFDAPIFTAKRFCSLVQDYQVTCFTAVPTMLVVIDKYKYLSNYKLEHLRYICFGGGNVSLTMLESLINKLPNAGIVQTYGQTECSPRVTALLPGDNIRKIGSVGKAIPGVEIQIVNDADEPVGTGEIGEIRVRGENTTVGYYKNLEETAKIKKGEWHYTGDLAKEDDDGYVYLVGRKKNVIISGGVNIYPEEIESVIASFAGIDDVLVKAEKDELLGEVVAAEIVLQSTVEFSKLELEKFLKIRLAPFKIPKKYYLRKTLPKTSTGKKQRHDAT
jgi:long-chain acyl-CoA synthetase